MNGFDTTRKSRGKDYFIYGLEVLNKSASFPIEFIVWKFRRIARISTRYDEFSA